MTVHGVDLSDYDRQRGPVDVASMRADGIVFLTHKATEGTTVRHAYYGTTLNAARAAGYEFLGAYMVVRTPGSSGNGTIAEQVAYFLAYLDAQTPWWRAFPGWFVQVDEERWSYDSVAPAYAAQAAQMLRDQTGKWTVEYASKGQYGDSLNAPVPLWNANYPTWSSSAGQCVAAPYRQAYANSGGDSGPGWTAYSGQTPVFWQFTDNGTVGTQPGCDVDAYRGTLDQLRALITGGDDMSWEQDIAIDPIPGVPAGQPGGPTGEPDGKEHHPAWAWLAYGNRDAYQAKLAADAAVAKVESMQTPAAPTQDQVDAAMLKALSDPSVIAALGAAVASHIHVS